MKKITQKQMAFYKLLKNRITGDNRYIPTWEFVGEMQIPELNSWVMMSYKCPTRLTDIFQENPDLIDREKVNGKSGSEYYTYRIKPDSDRHAIIENSLKVFFDKVYDRLKENN